ncbi:MAG: type 4a pilus biogenesis protein PilO [Deltaproteobacteria bacterium]|nr:type 4a pilus biogenesis protein PilO [Deltaproteobacteria bacterium]
MDFNFSQIDLKQEGSQREKIYFFIIMLLLVIAFARWFYIPKLKEIKLAQIELKNGLMQIDTLRQFAQLKLPELKPAQETEAVKHGTKFEKALAASMKSQQQVVAEMVKLLTSSYMLNGIALSGISFSPEQVKPGYATVPAAIEMDGKYSGIINYLGNVEKFGKLITIDNVELTSKVGTSVHAKINISIYVVTGGQKL